MKKFRLLLYGSKYNTNTIGAFIGRNISGGVEYEFLTFPDKFTYTLQSRINRVLYFLFPGLIVSRMDKDFTNQVSRYRPDLVLIFKGKEISMRSLIKVHAQGVKLVNYNFDHPFIHFSRGTGNRFVTEAIPYYDLHISYSSHIARQLHEKYDVKTAVLPFGHHLLDEQFEEIQRVNLPEINEVCFVGNPDALRIKMMTELLRNNVRINVYGFGWERYLKPSELVVVHPLRKQGSFWQEALEFWIVLRQYRVQLNFFRPHNEGSHNLRTFEVPAVGGILLTPDSDEQRTLFEPEQEIFFYRDAGSLVAQCKRLLSMPANRVQVVRENARKKSMERGYSYKDRTAELLKILENAL